MSKLHEYLISDTDYYEQLKKSDLFQGKVVAINQNNEQAVAGDYIIHLKCLICSNIIEPFLKWNEYYQNYETVCNVDCHKCSVGVKNETS